MKKLVLIKMNGNILFHFIGFGFEINMKKYIVHFTFALILLVKL
jgi:hypothetical protein